MRSIGWRRSLFTVVLVATAGSLAAAPGCVGDPNDVNFDDPWGEWQVEEVVAACTRSAILAGTPASRRGMIDRAMNWVDNRVQYSQTPQSRWGGYRTDCSGLVSMAWGLPAPGNTTHSFAGGPWDNRRSHRINWSELEPGDALNNPQHHIMLFAGWLDEHRTRFCTIEEYNWGRPASILHHSIYDNARGSQIRNIFQPVRLNGAPPSSGGGTSGGGTSGGGTSGGGASTSGAQCYSNTLQRWMPARSCVESRFDRDWYQCVDGVWRLGANAYGACVNTNPLSTARNATCFSSTLGRDMREGTCLQSRLDGDWYQCTDTGWVIERSLPGSNRGVIGACMGQYPLR